jgi:hypothetical protein
MSTKRRIMFGFGILVLVFVTAAVGSFYVTEPTSLDSKPLTNNEAKVKPVEASYIDAAEWCIEFTKSDEFKRWGSQLNELKKLPRPGFADFATSSDNERERKKVSDYEPKFTINGYRIPAKTIGDILPYCIDVLERYDKTPSSKQDVIEYHNVSVSLNQATEVVVEGHKIDFEAFKKQPVTYVDSIGTKISDMTNYEAFIFCQRVDEAAMGGNIHPEHPAIRWCDEFFVYYNYVYTHKELPTSDVPNNPPAAKDIYEFNGTSTCLKDDLHPLGFCLGDKSNRFQLLTGKYKFSWKAIATDPKASFYATLAWDTPSGGILSCGNCSNKGSFNGSKVWDITSDGEYILAIEAPHMDEWKVTIERIV